MTICPTHRIFTRPDRWCGRCGDYVPEPETVESRNRRIRKQNQKKFYIYGIANTLMMSLYVLYKAYIG